MAEEKRQAVLDAGDAAPHGEDVVALFQLGRGRRVVGADGVDLAGDKLPPETGDLLGGAQRWRAFRGGADGDGGAVV